MFCWISKLWQRYANWCDSNGLNPDDGRCCLPKVRSEACEHADNVCQARQDGSNDNSRTA